MASPPVAALTEEQYLDLERKAETKGEFYNGQMFAMAVDRPQPARRISKAGIQ